VEVIGLNEDKASDVGITAGHGALPATADPHEDDVRVRHGHLRD
jgi:hypothetical protein